MFKIAFIGQKGILVSQGGIERHVEELSVRLARDGHQVLVYTRPQFVPKEYKNYEKVKLISLPSINTKNLDAISHTFISIFNAIYKQKVDIIHLQGVGPSLLSWLPKILDSRVKIVATIHSADWEHQKWSSFAKFMLKAGCKFACKFADESLAVSRGLQTLCLQKYHSDVTYIPNGVGQPEKTNTAEKEILKTFDLQKNKYILVVSRLIKHKGIHYLIEAFKKMQEKYAHRKDIESTNFKNFKLVIVGSTSFTEKYQQYLIKLTKNNPDIIFTGAQTGQNLDAIFRNAYLYCQPSESEGLSIAVLEAMSHAKTVLISDIDENIELISGNAQTGAVGFDFKNKNIKDLTSKLEILIKHPEIVYKVGRKAHEYVKLYYNWEEIVSRTQKLYKNIVKVEDKLKKYISNFKPAIIR